MNGDDFIPLLGRVSDDPAVKQFLAAFGFKKGPKLASGEQTAILSDKSKGIDVTFRDERFLAIKMPELEEGALVLSNVRMYGPLHDTYEDFAGKLPLALSFDLGRKDVEKLFGRKPDKDIKFLGAARWDFEGYFVYATFDKKVKGIRSLELQFPKSIR